MKKNNLFKSNYLIMFFLICFSLLITSCSDEDDDDDDDEYGDWVERSTFNGSARGNASAFTIGDKGYLIGGFNGETDEHYSDIWLYNAENGNDYWQSIEIDESDSSTFPEARSGAIAFSIGEKGYYGTGRTEDGTLLNDFWEFDPSTNTWTQLADFDGTARSRAIGFSLADKGYIGTGNDGSDQKDFWEYDPSLDTWVEIDGYGGDKLRNGAFFIINDVAYIGTGENNGATLDDFFSFDGEEWQRLSDLSDDDDDDEDDDVGVYLTNSVGFSIDGKGYFATGSNGSASSSVFEYDVSSDSWSQLASFEGTSREGASVFNFDSSAYVFLGYNTTSLYFDDMYELFPDDIQD